MKQYYKAPLTILYIIKQRPHQEAEMFSERNSLTTSFNQDYVAHRGRLKWLNCLPFLTFNKETVSRVPNF
jgi:hypothetical protein